MSNERMKETAREIMLEQDNGVLEYWRLRFLLAGFDEHAVNAQFQVMQQQAAQDPADGMRMKREKVKQFRKYFD